MAALNSHRRALLSGLRTRTMEAECSKVRVNNARLLFWVRVDENKILTGPG